MDNLTRRMECGCTRLAVAGKSRTRCNTYRRLDQASGELGWVFDRRRAPMWLECSDETINRSFLQIMALEPSAHMAFASRGRILRATGRGSDSSGATKFGSSHGAFWCGVLTWHCGCA